MTFQSGAKCTQPFGNSLAVIEPVRTENQLTPRKSDAQALRSLLDCIGPCVIFKRVEVDPDREMPDANFAFFKADQLELAARNNFCVRHQAPHALEKIANVAPGLEPQKIELKKRAQESLLLRQLCKNV